MLTVSSLGRWVLSACVAAAAPAITFAADAPKPVAKKAVKVDRFDHMDYGPFLNLPLNAHGPGDNNTFKAVAIPLGTNDAGRPARAGRNESPVASVCFDQDLLRYSAGWTDGFIDYEGVSFHGNHGRNPAIRGEKRWATVKGPGWANPADGSFDDPRTPYDPNGTVRQGPLPAEWAKFKGIYRHGDTVVLSYTVGKTPVLETPGVVGERGRVAFTRSFTIGPSDRPMILNVADVEKGQAINQDGVASLTDAKGGMVAALSRNLPEGAKVEAADGRIRLTIPPHAGQVSFTLAVWGGPADGSAAFASSIGKSEAVDLNVYTKGGDGIWKETVETKVTVGKDDGGAYAVDTFEPPFNNPYKAVVRFGGFDFLTDGKSAVLSTWQGDVWHVGDISGTPEKITWRRIASGLFEPLGLKVRDGEIFVHCRDGIWRLNDLNKDGEVDFYEVFNNDVHNNPFFHEFAFDLQMDKDGNFYFAKAGPVNSGGSGFQKPISMHNGTMMKLSRDGKYLEVVATGFRAPTGIGINPETGQLTAGDNEGTWMPMSPLHWVTPGYFGGVVDLAHKPMKSTRKAPDLSERPNPVCWMPKSVDNSGGGQTWVTSDKWGPLKGNLLHTSYGQSSLYNVMYELVDGVVQGGVTKFPLKFNSGICRPRFSPFDGQLYVSGLTGWQSNGAKEAAFHRVRYTGKPLHMANGLKVTKTGLEITFVNPLDPATVTDAGNWAVQQWNYEWAEHYGSPIFSTKPGGKKGQKDDVEVKSAKLSPDGKTVTLELAEVVPVMQMHVKYNLKAADGAAVKGELYNTINRVPGSSAVAGNGPVSVAK